MIPDSEGLGMVRGEDGKPLEEWKQPMTLVEANAAWEELCDSGEATDEEFQQLQDELETQGFVPVWRHYITHWEAE